MVKGTGAPPRSHHVGEKKPPVKRAKPHGLSKEVAKKKKAVKSVKPVNLAHKKSK